MKLNIISDLHIDFDLFDYEVPEDADVIIIAGDVSGKYKRTVKWLKELRAKTDKHIIFVPGNHEYYGSFIHKANRELLEIEGITTLYNSTLRIGDCLFFGATLWTDFEFGDDKTVSKMHARELMNDYKHIKFKHNESYRKLIPFDTENMHRETMRKLDFMHDAWFLNDPNTKMVVISHHAPCGKSIPEKYLGHLVNSAYVSDLSEFILNRYINLWIHGHIHSSSDYMIGDTRVVCNPKGYNGENKEFNKNLIVEV